MKKSYWGTRIIPVCILWVVLCVNANVWAGNPPEEVTKVSQESISTGDLSKVFVSVAKKTIPSVVHIEVTQRQGVENPQTPFGNDPFFRYFFDVPKTPRKFKRELKGLGTGMIIDEKGNILTNNHVVAGASEILVVLSNGKQYPATVVGVDPKTDLAVIKISAEESLPHVVFGDSDKVEVGEWVVAIGHPRGLDQTVTQGIISAKHRQGITEPSNYQDFLQTDAAINPGNSGGPLLNLAGEVIGVNAVIASESGGFEGIGFAIPSNMALHVVKSLIASGKVERGWLGVTVQDLTSDKAKELKLELPKGALIVDVVKDGPAMKSGLQKDDVAIALNDEETPDASSLRNKIANIPIGQEAMLTIWRNGKMQDLNIKVGNLEDSVKMLADTLKEHLGIGVRSPSKTEAEKYGLGSQGGVIIDWLDPKGSMAAAGFELGDGIVAIDGQPIDSVESFSSYVNSLQPKQKITLLAFDHRSGQTGYVEVEVR